MFNHIVTTAYNDDGGAVASVATKYQGSTEVGFDGVVTAGSTNVAINLAWHIAGMQSFMVWSDQALTIKTNSSTSPAQTLSNAAGQIQAWGTGMGTNPITSDVTALYVTNAGTTDSKFKLRVLVT